MRAYGREIPLGVVDRRLAAVAAAERISMS
jgi:hypothetical protein